MTPQIDNVAVNSRGDWRSQWLPAAPQERTEHQFPGIAERFAVHGPTMPSDLMLVGYLEGTGSTLNQAMADLMAKVLALNTYSGDGLTHTITLYGVAYAHMECMPVQTLGHPEPCYAGGESGRKVRQAVRMVWRQMRFGGAS